jgi:dTDP-4-dehydrorhamnose reductase
MEKITKLKPKTIINSAAFTNVDAAEVDEEIAFKVNAYAVKSIAEACNEIDATIVHFSTDYVFDGKFTAYNEKAEKNPINVYGKSKSLGEDFLLGTTNKHYLIRTSWLFGSHGKNFVSTVLNLAQDKKELNIVYDQFSCPTYTKDLALKVKEVIIQDYGIFHIANDCACSKFEFACKIATLKGLDAKINPISAEQWQRAHPESARRPKFSALVNTKLPKLRHWEDALKEYLGIGTEK